MRKYRNMFHDMNLPSIILGLILCFNDVRCLFLKTDRDIRVGNDFNWRTITTAYVATAKYCAYYCKKYTKSASNFQLSVKQTGNCICFEAQKDDFADTRGLAPELSEDSILLLEGEMFSRSTLTSLRYFLNRIDF